MKFATAVSTTLVPSPSGAYSQAAIAGPFIFLAGQGPFDPTSREIVGIDIESQLRRVVANLEAVAIESRSTLAHAVRFGVYLRALSDAGIVNRVFEELLSPPFASRTTIQSDLTRFLVEVDAVLYHPQ